MTEPRFRSARITSEGLTTSWSEVPGDEERESLLLALLVQRDDGSEVRFGGRWTRGAEQTPTVFAWDSRSVQERTHEAAETAIERDGGDVKILFPRSWVDALIDAHELRGASLVTVDGVDQETTTVELDPEE